jgi:hypothetical protein
MRLFIQYFHLVVSFRDAVPVTVVASVSTPGHLLDGRRPESGSARKSGGAEYRYRPGSVLWAISFYASTRLGSAQPKMGSQP